MTQDLPPIILKGNDLQKFYKIKKQYPVSREFLHRNYGNIKRFIIYALNPHCVLRRYAWRKRGNRVILVLRIRHLLFDPRMKQMIKRRKRNVKQWSQRIVCYYKDSGFIEEYEETERYDVVEPKEEAAAANRSQLGAEELSKQMKMQLELLKSGKRRSSLTLVEDVPNKSTTQAVVEEEQQEREQRLAEEEEATESQCQVVNAATLIVENIEKSGEELEAEILPVTTALPLTNAGNDDLKPASEENDKLEQVDSDNKKKTFIDMLMTKVRVRNFAKESNFQGSTNVVEQQSNTVPPSGATGIAGEGIAEDSGDDFLGFDESGHQPGMLLTPLVPQSCKTLDGNAAFVSESLDEYMRKNHLRESLELPTIKMDKQSIDSKVVDGLVTEVSTPPYMEMPMVPESLQKLRTVADRRQYLQRFSKNHKMAIINNEANIYRELLRKSRNLKVKSTSMATLQSLNTQMPFTRDGWQAASYVATEINKYYYQVINVDGVEIKLPGSMGSNLVREKRPFKSRLNETELKILQHQPCSAQCLDAAIIRELKVIETREQRCRLNKFPLPAVFGPCPLSRKPFQKPLDDDTAALLLAGGSMAVVSMPTVQLEVEPQVGRPLDEIAKRYLQYILPHHNITREWAEFSVSTLQQTKQTTSSTQVPVSDEQRRKKSFTFVIPYLNDRNHILVRRVVDRSEQLDAEFGGPHNDPNPLLFRNQLTANADAVEMDCANMIDEMINTVVISCSENSFIRDDPDGYYYTSLSPSSNHEVKMDIDKPSNKLVKSARQVSKQNRLRLELRRLNATIIDAASLNEKSKEPCIKEHCQFGCVCESLDIGRPIREHCGRADCVFGCSCKLDKLTRVMRVETDGRGISNEDAFNLRRQATARLAKMEKEFTSTLVLTENETLLINESQCDKKRRCTKAPKRYEDFTDEEENLRPTPPKRELRRSTTNTTSVTALGKQPNLFKCSSAVASGRERGGALSRPCSVRDVDLVELQHCTVPLRRLPDMSNVASFCLTHQLYKCFCGGQSLEGKPIVIEKEKAPSIPTILPELATRARYSFERPPDIPETIKPQQSRQLHPQQEQQQQQRKDIKSNQSLITAEIAETKVLQSYMNANDQQCRRIIRIPQRCYLNRNRIRSASIRLRIPDVETSHTNELLNKRMIGAIQFYRIELDRQRRLEAEKLPSTTSIISMPETAIIEVRDDESNEEVSPPQPPLPVRQTSKTKNHKKSLPQIEPKQPKAKRIKLIKDVKTEIKEKSNFDNNEQPSVAMAPSAGDFQIPRIAACYSLNSAEMQENPSAAAAVAASADVLSMVQDATTSGDENSNSNSSSSVMNPQDINFRGFYNEVVKNMNTLVSKKMHDIDQALKRDSKIIPPPNEDILCIIKWTNFLAAFESELVHIWAVKMKNHDFLAATPNNMMPTVPGALGVINIYALGDNNFNMMAKMLMTGLRNERTVGLAVVMQGRLNFWLVKGFLRHTASNACTKPTPTTHPILTKKINVLCSLLVKQRMREHQRRVQEISGRGGNNAPAATAAVVPQPPPLPVPPQQQESPLMTVKIPSPPPPTTTTPPPTLPPQPPLPKLTSTLTPTLPKAAVTVKPAPLPVAPPAPLPLEPSTTTKDAPFNIRSNIEFRKLNHEDVQELQIPELHSYDHRWVVLDLFNDFSHIFVPAFKDMISLDRILNVMKVAAEKQKVVKLQFFKDAPYDAFVTSMSRRKIYFGPLHLDIPPPVLVLLQSVDGQMMLREVYQQEHRIPVRQDRRTTAFWVMYIKGQVQFEIKLPTIGDLLPAKGEPISTTTETTTTKPTTTANDDDCVIIDDDDEEDNDGDEEDEVDDYLMASEGGNEEQTKIGVSTNGVSVSPPKISFTIQSGLRSGSLQITPVPQNVAAVAAAVQPPKELSTCGLTGGFVPFIAKSPAAAITTIPTPLSLPSIVNQSLQTQYIRPNVQITKTTATSVNVSTEHPQPPPTKVPRLNVQQPNKINESLQQLLGSGNAPLPITPKAQLPKQTIDGSKIPVKRTVTGLVKTTIGVSIDAVAKDIRQPSAKTTGMVRQSLPAKVTTNKPILPTAAQPRRSEPHVKQLPTLVNKEPTVTSVPTPITIQTDNKGPKYGQLKPINIKLPSFKVKITDHLIVKVPEVGMLRMKNIPAANNFLNRHLMSNVDYKPYLPSEWKFELAPTPVRQRTIAPKSVVTAAPKSAPEVPILIED